MVISRRITVQYTNFAKFGYLFWQNCIDLLVFCHVTPYFWLLTCSLFTPFNLSSRAWCPARGTAIFSFEFVCLLVIAGNIWIFSGLWRWICMTWPVFLLSFGGGGGEGCLSICSLVGFLTKPQQAHLLIQPLKKPPQKIPSHPKALDHISPPVS